jgi:hypothetical protein
MPAEGDSAEHGPAGRGPAPSVRPLVVERAEVGGSHVDARVRVTAPQWMRTSATPGLADAVLALLPGLIRHRCECGSAHGIRQELADTETPHLLEHVALELMVLAGSPRDLGGETTWDFSADGPGVFRVRIGFDDDLVALGALERGAALVNALLAGERPAATEQVASELRELRVR